MGGGIANDTALADPGAAHLKLGFNQQQRLPAPRGQQAAQGL
jgi:hypothetical protein